MNSSLLEYNEYIGEYLEEANHEMMTFLEVAYKLNYYLRDNLLTPSIVPVLAQRKNRDKIVEFTGIYIDNHATQLQTAGPVHKFTFLDKETNVLYELFNLSKEKVLELSRSMFQETYDKDMQFYIIKEAPHKVLITAMLVGALHGEYDDVVTCCEYLMGFSEYPLMYHNFWKTGVQEDIMAYTMEHLGNKYKVKSKNINNLLGLIKYDMDVALTNHVDALKSDYDNEYIRYIYRVRDQMSKTFKNIAREYYKNWENNATQHSKSSHMDDGNLSNQEGQTSIVATIVENTYSKFLTSPIYSPIVTSVSENRQIDKSTLLSYLNQIFSLKENNLYKFLEDVITAYFLKGPTNQTVGNQEFVSFGLALYRSIGTSKNPLYQEIRQILNYWMFDVIKIKEYTTNNGTIINYTRGIYDYMIWMISHHN